MNSVPIDNRMAVFRAVAKILKEEEEAWKEAREANSGRFAYCFGVRAAPELAIAYLTWREILCRSRVTGFVEPERKVSGGMMDLWIGDCREGPGLGIEFKFLMSGKEARTVVPQAERLWLAPDVSSAAFVMWGHGPRNPEEVSLNPARFTWPIADGRWTQWKELAHEDFPARYKEDSQCHVWLYGSDRIALVGG